MSVYRVSSNKSSVNNFPTVRPTLDLDFANSKTLDPRITFTRSSGGSYVGADGLIKLAGVNEARFDHDPYTGESLGLLVEEARTNLLLRSDYSTNNSLSLNNVTLTLNATTAPDGTNTAVSIDGVSSANNVKYMFKNFSTSTIETYTTSVFVKYKSERFILLRLNDNTGVNDTRQLFDILNGIKSGNVVNGGTATGASSTITAYPNGWYRLSVTVTFNSALTQIQGAAVYLTGFTNTTTTNGVFVWGAQLEVGAFPTSYIPTVASTRTRAADNASITGKNFSEWYRPDEGTVYAEWTRNSSAGAVTGGGLSVPRVWATGTSAVGLIQLRPFSATSLEFIGSGINLYIPHGVWGVSQVNKTASAYKSNDSAAVVNNRSVVIDSTVGSFEGLGIDRLAIGSNSSGNSPINGTIARLTYYPKRLPNAQLQALTK